ncbi:hypothetical protein AB833_06925 [Chromatiales bacterium (ex Bugula neritina AB1)]|nr:hypothetical protein AB833_06925 [Chromatiales bacterium (ex Bugula neritina AB1)]
MTLDLATWLLVEIETQQLRYFEQLEETSRFPVSTSWRGAGCRNGTFCTPLGWHRVVKKIGDGCKPGTIFSGRVAGAVASSLKSDADDDLITSRILWLDGLQPGYNRGGEVDSRSRYIYIHGTTQEHLIGRAESHGCIRMRNDHVIELFDQTKVDVPVYISQHALH